MWKCQKVTSDLFFIIRAELIHLNMCAQVRGRGVKELISYILLVAPLLSHILSDQNQIGIMVGQRSRWGCRRLTLLDFIKTNMDRCIQKCHTEHRNLHLAGTLDVNLSSVSLSARICSTISMSKDEQPLNTSSDNNLTMVQGNQFYCSIPLSIRKFCLNFLHLLVWVLLPRAMQIQTVPSSITMNSCTKFWQVFSMVPSYSYLLVLWTCISYYSP